MSEVWVSLHAVPGLYPEGRAAAQEVSQSVGPSWVGPLGPTGVARSRVCSLNPYTSGRFSICQGALHCGGRGSVRLHIF